jgi:hypothetical protein
LVGKMLIFSSFPLLCHCAVCNIGKKNDAS